MHIHRSQHHLPNNSGLSAEGSFFAAFDISVMRRICLFILCSLLTGNYNQTLADECGEDMPGQDTITCNDTSIKSITYRDSDGLTLNIDHPDMRLTGTAAGVSVDSSPQNIDGDITINALNFEIISSSPNPGVHAYIRGSFSTGNATVTQEIGEISISAAVDPRRDIAGIQAETEGISGNTLTQMNGGIIRTSGDLTNGIRSANTNPNATGSATARMTQGEIQSVRHGINVSQFGLGSALAEISSGSVNTSNSYSNGVYSDIANANSSSPSTIRNTGGDITTIGDFSRGLAAHTAGTGVSSTEMTGGTITTSGLESHGIMNDQQNVNNTASSTILFSGGSIVTNGDISRAIFAINTGQGVSSAEMSGGTVTTSGQASHGIMSDQQNANSGVDADAIAILSNGSIVTNGINSHGILARNAGAGDAIISATGGTISANGNGVSALSARGNVQVTVDTQVTGSSSNAVRTETAAGQTSTITIGGSADISSTGGRAIFNDEGDSLTTIAAGALVAGEILLNNGSDTLDIQGADIADITLMDGGDDADSSDGWIDRLTLRNLDVANTIDGTNIINWEEVSFVDSTLEVDDLITETVNLSGGTTTLGGASAVDDVLGSAAAETVTVTDNTTVANVIEGAGGDDVLSVLGNASVNDGVFGGGDGNDASGLADGADTITIDTTGSVLLVDGGAGNDIINLLSGTVTTDVLGQTGGDTITLNGATVTGNIDGGAGDDTLVWQSGSVAELHGGDGSDTVEVSAAEYDNTQILDGGDNDDEANGVVDRLTLRGLEMDLADNGTISNWEVIVFDASTISFADGATGTSAALLLTNGSILNGGDGFIHNGNMSIAMGSNFQGAGGGQGAYQVQNLANNGTVNLQDLAVGDTFTTLGDYSGSGALLLDVDLAQASADTLVVGGDVSGGTTTIAVQDIEVDPAPPGSSASSRVGDKILLVDVGGTTAEGDFSLSGDGIIEGALTYSLELENSQWLLAPGLNSPGAASAAAPSILLDAFTKLPTFNQRTGGRQWLWRENDSEGRQSAGRGVWLRFSGDHIDAKPEVNIGAFNGTYQYDSDIRNTQTGIETRLPEGRNGQWILGLTAQYGTVDAVISNRLGRGSVEATGYGAGLTATWQGNNGLYLDAQGQFNWIDSDIASAADGRLIDGHASTAQSLSLEVGRRFALNDRHSIIPQMQFSWGCVDGDRYIDSLGNEVDPSSNESLMARFGMSYNFQLKDADGKYRKNLYAVGNLLPNFSDASEVRIGNVEVASENDPTMAEIGIGGSFALNKNTSLYAEGSRREALFNDSDDDYGYSFSVGMNMRW